jgi:2-haloacid dehalogenase
MLDLAQYDSLSFDCYGTLIDWESGLLQAFSVLLKRAPNELDREDLLRRYAQAEAELERGPYMPYREVLRSAAKRIAFDLQSTLTDEDTTRFADSIREWQPFPDTVPALKALKQRYKLYILSNVDDDLFASTALRLEVPFDGIITAQQIGSYKPERRIFERLLEVVGGRERHLHVAESLFHDHAPAQSMGMRSIWINRSQGREGATAKVAAPFDLELPNLKDLAALAAQAKP